LVKKSNPNPQLFRADSVLISKKAVGMRRAYEQVIPSNINDVRLAEGGIFQLFGLIQEFDIFFHFE
jgi:hypothetical protein